MKVNDSSVQFIDHIMKNTAVHIFHEEYVLI